jgi:LuxR family maltose regulon positive regulatory protein
MAEDWVVRALHQQSDGWAAGITLMVERLKRAGDGAGTISGETRESVFNYFASLILDQAPQRARETLLAIAFPPRVTPSLAQALSGDAEAGKLLDSLHRRQLFTDRRPGPEPVYQFHALFQEFLRTKAAQGLSRAQLCERLRRSGLELQQRGDWEAAFELLVHAEAWDEAGALTVACPGTVGIRAMADAGSLDRRAAGPASTLAGLLAGTCAGTDRPETGSGVVPAGRNAFRARGRAHRQDPQHRRPAPGMLCG